MFVCLLQAQAAEAQVLSYDRKAPEALGEALIFESDSQNEANETAGKKTIAATPAIEAQTSEPFASGFTIDTSSRNDVAAAYHAYFISSEDYASIHGYTGDVDNCVPGTLSDEFQEMTLRRVNYYRAQAGLPADIYFTAAKNAKAQKAATIMAHINDITHYPANDYPSDACVLADQADGSEGIEAASKSNLSLGTFGPRSVDGQMTDDGSNNTVVGHRRWILYSRAQEMGNGATPPNGNYPYTLPEHPAIDCLWVIGDFKAAPEAQAVPWPNEGYVPWTLAPNDGESYPRWSYSYPGADFSGASVSMNQGASSISLTQEPLANGYGDNTIVWRPTGIPDSSPINDTSYTITINGISGAPFNSVSYDVILIDPYKLNSLPGVTGPGSPVYGSANNYDFSTVEQAEAYQVRITEINSSSWQEGAEDSPTPQVTDDTDSSYSLISSAYSATGSKAFHLATPDSGDDSYTIDRTLYPQSGSEIHFKYRRFWMHPNTKLHLELSNNEGASFSSIYTLSGQNTSGNSLDWDASFTSETVSIPTEFLDQSVLLKFRITVEGSYFRGSASTYGLHIDDISVSNCLELTAASTIDLDDNADSFAFTPPSSDQDYLLQVRPQLGGHWFGYGDALAVTSVPLPAPVINSPNTATGSQGEIFSYTITATNQPSSYGATDLPPGASINSETGILTGQIAPGLYTDTRVSATNSTGSDEIPLTIEILTGYEATVKNSYPGLGGPLEDDDLDGIPNLIELSLANMDPTRADAHVLPSATITGGNFILSVSKSGIPGVDYAIVGADSLQQAAPWDSETLTIIADDVNTLTVSYPISASLQYFLRLVVTQNNDTTMSP